MLIVSEGRTIPALCGFCTGTDGHSGTYIGTASPARLAGPPATAPRRRSRPCSTSDPSRSSARRSTRPRSTPRWGRTGSHSPVHRRGGQLGASLLKGVSV